MSKIHWGPLLTAAAAGLALSALPSNSAIGSTLAGPELTSGPGLSEFSHGLLVLFVVLALVILTRLHTRDHGSPEQNTAPD